MMGMKPPEPAKSLHPTPEQAKSLHPTPEQAKSLHQPPESLHQPLRFFRGAALKVCKP
jgi:hypothetical protein